jgi:starch-binding outer membrane protein, SusD/RagB family
MRKYLYLPLLVSLMLPIGCAKEFLDREPISELTEGNFFKTRADAESALIAAYDAFQSEYYIFDRFINGDVTADNCYAGGDNPNNFQIDEFKITPINQNVERDWRYLYEGISRANAVLDNVANMTASDLSDLRKKEILGEAATLRAIHYFQLVNLWGDVPLVLKKVNSTDPREVNQPRASVQQVYDAIIADLERAISQVNASYPQGEQRITGAAVRAMLAKAFAHQPTPDWTRVLLHTMAITDDPAYQLLNAYDQLWDGQNENSRESIFEVQYIGGTNEANWGPQLWLPPNLTGDSWRKFNTPSNNLIAAFDAAGDNVRKNSSITFRNNVPWSDPKFPSGSIPFPFKQRLANGWSSPNNFILLRLADIILLQAEAKNELNDLEGARTDLNRIRSRVNLPANTATNKEEMREAIANERRLELAFEGHRWFDLKRTGKAIATMNAVNPNYQVDANKLLWPIPQTEMDRNPNLVQNDGY